MARYQVKRKLLPLRRNSVSYTHLRAHETVLDLVCRLLLEKKKNKKYKEYKYKNSRLHEKITTRTRDRHVESLENRETLDY